tara:strand:- start:6087 stop:6965 length:879 start_codon:yes stop_codon:yes gene_type:complete
MKQKNKKIFNTNIISSNLSIIISLSLVLFIIGSLALILINAQKVSNYVKENIGFTIMINKEINEVEIMRFQKELDAKEFSKHTKFISKEEATKNLSKELGEDFVTFLGYSPLLASIDVKLNASYANSDSLIIIKEELVKNNNVFEIYYQKDLVDKINNNVKKLATFLITFFLLLFIISFVLINNTIRLSVYSKRFMIRTMRLVGATNSFIQKPFIIKGLYQGLYSAIFAVFMLIGSMQLIQKETANILNINDLKIIGLVFLLIFFFGLVIGLISTLFAVKKYIKLTENELYK